MIYKPQLKATLQAMDPEEKIAISLDDFTYSSIRNASSTLGKETERSYTVHLNRGENNCIVIRNS